MNNQIESSEIIAQPLPTNKKFQNLTGQRFNRWKVLFFVGLGKGGKDGMWYCSCDCGSLRVVNGGSVKRGGSKSCGCLQRELAAKAHTTHGLGQPPEYCVWATMKQRCYDPKVKCYFRYGGRGIKVCERWLKFENFYSDMGPRPSPNFTLERVKNSGNYEPSNCVWDTRREQARNRRSNRTIEFNGETKCLAEWGEQLGLRASVIKDRIDRYGWSIERALTQPLSDGWLRRR